MMGEKSPIVPILAGAGGAIIASMAAERLGLNPNVAAWGTAAVGAATALGTKGVARQVATGVGAGGACLGALSLFGSAKAISAQKEIDHQKQQKRQAEGDQPYITRQELNDALGKMADGQKQQACDLLTALDDRIKRIVGEAQKPAPSPSPLSTGRPNAPFPQRGASGEDEYMRNAYDGFDERNAPIGEDEYMRNAYGDEDERNAYADEYERNAYADDERNAFADESERNAYADDERNADEYERNAYTDDERNAVGDDYSTVG